MQAPDSVQEDARVRARALETDSFIVEAPAGAGKTELLTQRYLRLLALVGEPEEIVAITFTNKAAAEMRGRVLQSLQDATDEKPVDKPHRQITRRLALAALERSRALEWNLLQQPGRLRISTIDALSSMLARQMPLMSRFGAQPAVTDDAAEHYHEAARRTLSGLEAEQGVGSVTAALTYFDNDMHRLAAQLAQMLQRRDQWLEHAGRDSTQEEMAATLEMVLGEDIVAATAMLTPELQYELMPLARYAASNVAGDHAVAMLLDWTGEIPCTVEALPQWRALCELLLTQEGRRRRMLTAAQGFPPTDEGNAAKGRLLAILENLPDSCIGLLARLRTLPDLPCDDAGWRMVVVLADLLRTAAAHLWIVFQEAGVVDFVEVSLRALAALEDGGGPTELALRLDYRVQHVLVDEFQDTSPSQVELLRRLTRGWEAGDGRTLFCVGDPMQSIYRFRKADVGLFLQAARSGIGDLKLQRLCLALNNRSCPEVVAWVNQAFRAIFPAEDNGRSGAIRYREFVAARAEEPGAGVFVHPLRMDAASERGESTAQEARVVVSLITGDRQQFPQRSMAVLVRARAHLEALVAEIRRHHPGLPFQAVEIESLSGRQSVQDALALVRALLHRADRVHWLAVLRAPWCGLELEDLHKLAAHDHRSTVWELMQDERPDVLSADGWQRLLHVRGVLKEAYAHQGRQTLRRWLEGVWVRLGGPQCLWNAGDVRDVQAFFDLVEKLDNADRFDPDRLEEAMQDFYASADALADKNLQFMTIHKAKGLEFDTVILPGLHRPPRAADRPLVLWEQVLVADSPSRLVAAPRAPRRRDDGRSDTYDYLQKLEQQRDACEAARLLYVAATRAGRRLHLVGAVWPDAKGEFRPQDRTFLKLLWPVGEVGARFAAAVPQGSSPADAEDEAEFIPRLRRLPLRNLAVPPVPAVDPDLLAPPTASAPQTVENLDTHCGILAHRYLDMMVRDGLAVWNAARLHALRPAMRRWLQRQGYPPAVADSGVLRVAGALEATLQSADGRWVLQEHSQPASEWALVTLKGAETTTQVMDRTFVEDGVRWVVDYKLARLEPDMDESGWQQAAELHRDQLERYAAVFAGNGLPVKKAVLFIACGRLVTL